MHINDSEGELALSSMSLFLLTLLPLLLLHNLFFSFHTTFVYFPSTITTTTITDTTTFPIFFLLLLQLLILILVVNSSFAPSSSLLLFSFLLLGYIVFHINRLYQVRQAKIRPKVRKRRRRRKSSKPEGKTIRNEEGGLRSNDERQGFSAQAKLQWAAQMTGSTSYGFPKKS